MRQHTPLPTEMRRRVQRALKTCDFRGALTSNTGAIDLASIMVGVIVIGVIAGVIAATVFAVIPWSQNAAAKQSLDAVRTAESVTRVQDNRFTDMAGLITASRIQTSTKVSVGTDAAGTCYVGVSKSATGKVFYITDAGPDVKELTAATVVTCTVVGGIDLLVTSVGGPDPAAAPLPDQFATLTATLRTGATTKPWKSVASSADGTRLAAMVADEYVYTSADSGANWTARPSIGARAWNSITSSDDGMRLVAGAASGYLYISSDAGATWVQQTVLGVGQWGGVAMSNDGQVIIASSYASSTKLSKDGGVTWFQQGSPTWSTNFDILSASADGKIVVGLSSSDGLMYLSMDSGITFSPTKILGTTGLYIMGVAVSDDGKTIVTTTAAFYGNQAGAIKRSTDYGATWTDLTGAGLRNWGGITASADGTKIIAGVNHNNGYVYTSKDSGVTWTERTSLGQKTWMRFAASADGSKVVAADFSGLYTFVYGP